LVSNEGAGCGGVGQEQDAVSLTEAADAVDSGIWEALEELRLDKSALEAKLKGATMREDALREKLDDLSNRAHSESPVDSLMRSENDALRRNISLLEERLEAASSWFPSSPQKPPQPPCLEKRDKAEESESTAALREAMRSENEALRRERKLLQERLDVFERALQLESPRNGGGLDPSELDNNSEDSQHKRKIGEGLDKLHSQFLNEVVGLRREVAGLKKKKWVLRSVLASGGESERIAIENEVNELRKATGSGAGCKKGCEDKGEENAEVSLISSR
jgi:hypothetical protein